MPESPFRWSPERARQERRKQERRQQDDDEDFRLTNPTPKPEPTVFETPKARQIPLLRGLDDCPGQQDLWDGAHVS